MSIIRLNYIFAERNTERLLNISEGDFLSSTGGWDLCLYFYFIYAQINTFSYTVKHSVIVGKCHNQLQG